MANFGSGGQKWTEKGLRGARRGEERDRNVWNGRYRVLRGDKRLRRAG